MKKIVFYIQVLFLYITVMPMMAMAQKKESTALIHEFMQISNSYKQAPLYLEIEMKNTSNFITSEQDTLYAAGKIYLQPGSSFMQFGEIEQWVNDSVAVLVSNKLQRIIINTSARPLADQLKTITGSLLKDSSISSLSKKYTAAAKTINGSSVIELNSRDLLPGSELPKQTIQMIYHSKTKQPMEVSSAMRMLVPLSEEDYKKLNSDAETAKMLIAIENKGYFLIKEQATSFIYKTVTHEANMKIPVAISDRIVKNKNGEFEPVKAYEDYEITIN